MGRREHRILLLFSSTSLLDPVDAPYRGTLRIGQLPGEGPDGGLKCILRAYRQSHRLSVVEADLPERVFPSAIGGEQDGGAIAVPCETINIHPVVRQPVQRAVREGDPVNVAHGGLAGTREGEVLAVGRIRWGQVALPTCRWRGNGLYPEAIQIQPEDGRIRRTAHVIRKDQTFAVWGPGECTLFPMAWLLRDEDLARWCAGVDIGDIKPQAILRDIPGRLPVGHPETRPDCTAHPYRASARACSRCLYA